MLLHLYAVKLKSRILNFHLKMLRYTTGLSLFFFFFFFFLVSGTPGHNAGYPIYLRLFTFIYIGSPSIITIMRFKCQ